MKFIYCPNKMFIVQAHNGFSESDSILSIQTHNVSFLPLVLPNIPWNLHKGFNCNPWRHYLGYTVCIPQKHNIWSKIKLKTSFYGFRELLHTSFRGRATSTLSNQPQWPPLATISEAKVRVSLNGDIMLSLFSIWGPKWPQAEKKRENVKTNITKLLHWPLQGNSCYRRRSQVYVNALQPKLTRNTHSWGYCLL